MRYWGEIEVVQGFPLTGEEQACPAVDLYETGDTFVIECDLPGVHPAHLKVSLSGTRITLECKGRGSDPGGPVHRYLCVERSPEAFIREILLPGPVRAGECSAVYENGVLTVRLAKLQERRGRRIEIPVETK